MQLNNISQINLLNVNKPDLVSNSALHSSDFMNDFHTYAMLKKHAVNTQ